MTHKLLTGVSANLRMFQREGSGLNEVGQRAALGESAAGRLEASQATRWHQPESRTAQSPVALHVVRERDRQATNGSAHTASNSNWLTTQDSGHGDDRTGESQNRPAENTGMEIDGEVPGQEQGSELTEATVTGKKRGLEFRVPTCRRRGKAADELNCRAVVRRHVNGLMGRKSTDAPLEPASTEAVLNYKSTLNEEDGPSMEHFQADFSEKSPENSVWNRRLCELFVDDYAKQGLPFTTVTKLPVFFMTYLETLQTTNRKMAATAEQARAYKKASQRNRIKKRKKTMSLHMSKRVDADIVGTIYQRFDTQISALHYYKISWFIKPLEEMSRSALSDDESDHEQGTHGGQSCYSIVNESWRSKELVVWLRTIDLFACGEKWGGRNIARQGNSRRIRLHSTRSKDGIAIAGLPENCYNVKWLNSLKRYQRDKLDVQPPVDLTFSEEEKRLAAQFIPLAKGDARPLQSFEDQLDNIQLTVGEHNDTIKGDVIAGFSSLQSRLDDFKSSIETSRRGWQANFEESVHKKLYSVEAALADILKALPVPEDNTIKQTPITALDPQPLACPRHPEGQSPINGEGPESIIVDRKDEATNLTVPTVAEEQLLTPPSEPKSLINSSGPEGPESTIVDRKDEDTNFTVLTVAEDQLLAPPGEPRSGKETCGIVQPQTTNNYLHGVEGLGVDVSAEHLLKGFEPYRENGELAECQLISIFRFIAFPSDTTPPSMFCLPTFPPGDGPQSPQVMHTVPTHHPIRATLTCCLVAKPGHTPPLKKDQKISVVPHWCVSFIATPLSYRSFAPFTGPILCLSASSCQVTVTVLDRPFKAWCYGATFRNTSSAVAL
ncbi:hypothetical protein EDB86DRAFT_3086249 [Lactarius hatsudake]|nr:hypothetical protein EDB86DRAFT_3086249 [Lactarius hatsudake]